MSIYTNAVYGMRKRAYDGPPTESPREAQEIDTLRGILDDPSASTRDKIQAAYSLQQLGVGIGDSIGAVAQGALSDVRKGFKQDRDAVLSRLHKKYIVAKNDAISRYNKFKADLPGMYAEGKKQLGDFYDANKSAIWAGGLGALGGGTIGASVAKNKLLGGLVGAGVGAGVSLGALRIAKYLGYDI
jgi:hypothetical protein